MTDFQDFNEFRKQQNTRQEPNQAEVVDVKREDKKAGHVHWIGRLQGLGWQIKKRLNPIKKIAYVVLFAFIILACILVFGPISFGEFRVIGVEMLSREDIIYISKVNQPINFFRVDTSDMEERLNGDLRIAQATVERKNPFYIEVQVEERRPLAVLEVEFGYVVIDKTGVVIDCATVIRNVDAPMITGVDLGNVLLGDKIDNENIAKGLEYLDALSIEGWEQISEVNVSDLDSIVAYTRNGIGVRLGKADQIEEQAPLSENMLKDVHLRSLEALYIDVNLNSPYIKMK